MFTRASIYFRPNERFIFYSLRSGRIVGVLTEGKQARLSFDSFKQITKEENEKMSATTKEIGWAYPSSTNAAKCASSKTGCFTVEIVDAKGNRKLAAGLQTFAAAKSYADAIAVPYGRYSMKEVV